VGVNLTDPVTAPATPGVTTTWLRRLAIASLVANILIVVSGGVVRLTASGLGCPTWPRCTEESLLPHRELGIHGAIEFGNRMVTFLVAAVAIATFLVALKHGRRSITRLAFLLGLGVPAQALVGGVTVLTDLNPWVVAFHLLVSMAMIGLAVVLLRRLREGDGSAVLVVPTAVAWLVRLTFLAGWAVLYVGTVVTGSGPHAGDLDAVRTGLDPQLIAQLHADLVFLLVGLTIACIVALFATGAPARVRRAAVVLLAVELSQGLIGYTQYFLKLPALLVAMHMLGASLIVFATVDLVLAARERTADEAVAA
jgi:heme a synthase